MKNIGFDFNGKVALVTGASSGIGRAIAIQFADRGAKVVVADWNEDLGLQTAQMIQKSGGEAFFQKCDVSNAGEVKKLIDNSVAKYGQLNMACNNAGIEGRQGFTADCTEENWDKVLNVNLKGVWLCMKYEIPEMLKHKGGAIVNISSIAGLVGFSGLPAYVASKHGIVGLTKTAALEYANQNIRINAICPGPIMTPMLERLMNKTPGMKEQLTSSVPERRIGSPEDIANSVLFLCSEPSAYITGHCLPVDGGWVAQ